MGDGRDGEELGGVEEGETIIRVYYVRKKFNINKRGKNKEEMPGVVAQSCNLSAGEMDTAGSLGPFSQPSRST